jgi:hypothetical protein
MQIHNHVYSLIGVYFEKTVYKHKYTSRILHNSRESTKMALCLNVVFFKENYS